VRGLVNLVQFLLPGGMAFPFPCSVELVSRWQQRSGPAFARFRACAWVVWPRRPAVASSRVAVFVPWGRPHELQRPVGSVERFVGCVLNSFPEGGPVHICSSSSGQLNNRAIRLASLGSFCAGTLLAIPWRGGVFALQPGSDLTICGTLRLVSVRIVCSRESGYGRKAVSRSLGALLIRGGDFRVFAMTSGKGPEMWKACFFFGSSPWFPLAVDQGSAIPAPSAKVFMGMARAISDEPSFGWAVGVGLDCVGRFHRFGACGLHTFGVMPNVSGIRLSSGAPFLPSGLVGVNIGLR